MPGKSATALGMKGAAVQFCLFPGLLLHIFLNCQLYRISNLHMKKIGRNEPCPCGSGKKYKKCCIHVPTLPEGGNFVYTDLDELSNRIPDLIDQRKFDEAEAVCSQLMKQYPEQIDGLHRFAELYEAMGESEKAASYYHKAANFALLDGGFDKRTVDRFREKAEELNG